MTPLFKPEVTPLFKPEVTTRLKPEVTVIPRHSSNGRQTQPFVNSSSAVRQVDGKNVAVPLQVLENNRQVPASSGQHQRAVFIALERHSV